MTSRQRLDLKTIGGADAIARAERVLRRRPPNADGLRRLREVRNGLTHLGQGDDPAQVRALLAAGVGYLNELLGELGEVPATFWEGYEPLTTDLLEQAVTELELRYQQKLRRAREVFDQRFARMAPQARAAQVKVLSEVPVLTRWHMVAPATCPACGSPAMASGRDYSEDFGSWFAPRFFGCRVCELRLEGAELELAGMGLQFLNGYDEDRDWEPDEDDDRRMAAAEDANEATPG